MVTEARDPGSAHVAADHSFGQARLERLVDEAAAPSDANLKAKWPTTTTGDLMLPVLEMLIMLRRSNRQTELRFLLVPSAAALRQASAKAPRRLLSNKNQVRPSASSI